MVLAEVRLGNQLSFLLAQRAASEGPRWTRVVKDSLATLLMRGEKNECVDFS